MNAQTFVPIYMYCHGIFISFFLFVVLGIKLRALSIVGTCFTIELQAQPLSILELLMGYGWRDESQQRKSFVLYHFVMFDSLKKNKNYTCIFCIVIKKLVTFLLGGLQRKKLMLITCGKTQCCLLNNFIGFLVSSHVKDGIKAFSFIYMFICKSIVSWICPA